MSSTFFPRSIRYLGGLVLIQVALFSTFRVLFWGYFNSPTDPLSSSALLQAMYVGFKFDLRLALFLIVPILLLGLRGPLHLYGVGGGRIWQVYAVIVFFLAILLYTLHFGHYAYLHEPLNSTILRFFADPLISMTMLWQTYPVLRILLGLVVVSAVYAWIIDRYYNRLQHAAETTFSWRGKSLRGGFIACLVIAGLWGKWSQYPLRWSDAYFQPHPFVAAVTVNPILHLVSTFKNRQVSFDKQTAQQAYPLVADYLAVDKPDPSALSYVRQREGGPLAKTRPNVVLVLLESFATFKTSLTGNPLQPTPVIADVAANAIYFPNFFVPHTGTARSVFTTLTGLPDIEVQKTSTRNPLIVGQHTIINDFDGYRKLYFIGGSASWGNIRGLLANNIKGLQLYEEGSYRSPRIDVWGVSDLHLFEEANEVLDRLGGENEDPFFAIIQTSGNHRPYTIPEDNHGFQYSTLDNATVRKHGFESNEEFNSFRFMDHSIGYFLAQARKSSYFANTLFVFYGDHGIHAETGPHTPQWEQRLGLQGLRVPLLFYAPKLIPRAEVIDTLASEVDVLPSIAGLVARQYTNTTLGRNLFDPRYADNRYAFTVTHGNGLTLGLLGPEFYYQVHESGADQALFRVGKGAAQDSDARRNVMQQFPQQAEQYAKICTALFETVKYMRYNNKEPDKKTTQHTVTQPVQQSDSKADKS